MKKQVYSWVNSLIHIARVTGSYCFVIDKQVTVVLISTDYPLIPSIDKTVDTIYWLKYFLILFHLLILFLYLLLGLYIDIEIVSYSIHWCYSFDSYSFYSFFPTATWFMLVLKTGTGLFVY